jgi:hypothetical protein
MRIMAKRSPINAIKLKQSGPYKGVPRTPGAIHAIPTLKSWPGGAQPPQHVRDAQAERIMSAGYSKKRNRICPIHYIMTSNTGACIECGN